MPISGLQPQPTPERSEILFFVKRPLQVLRGQLYKKCWSSLIFLSFHFQSAYCHLSKRFISKNVASNRFGKWLYTYVIQDFANARRSQGRPWLLHVQLHVHVHGCYSYTCMLYRILLMPGDLRVGHGWYYSIVEIKRGISFCIYPTIYLNPNFFLPLLSWANSHAPEQNVKNFLKFLIKYFLENS